jgi:hypothetical protein
MFGLIKFIALLFRSGVQLLDPDKNQLRHAPMEVKYLASILLGTFWCLAFGIWTGELLWIGYNMIGHVLIITMAFVTAGVFYYFKKTYEPRIGADYLRSPDRSPRCQELTDEERLAAVKQQSAATILK